MSQKEYFGGTVGGGKVTFDDPLRWKGVLARFEGRRVVLTVRGEQLQRSQQQNKYYWSMVVPIFSEWTGYEKEEAHEVLKGLFLKTRRTLPTGEEIEVSGSSAKLTVAEFKEYVDQVCRWLAGHGVYVPEPGERAEAIL